jgi:Fe-S oxidoreductase
MFNYDKAKEHFGKECTACGICVEVCPIIPDTDLNDVDPSKVMQEVLGLFHNKAVSEVVKTRVDSCMRCNSCKPHCPEGLDPGLGLCLARQILVEVGEPIPRGLSFLLPDMKFNLTSAIEAIQIKPGEGCWVSDVTEQKPALSKTVLFAGCRGHTQPDLIMTAFELIRRIDPSTQVLAGLSYCCGDMHLRAGNPGASVAQLSRLVEGLNAFSPKKVVFLCPTCKSIFDLNKPDTDWSWQFATDYLADHLDKLGPFQALNTTITIHDACNLVRGEKPESESPRKILKAIPGVNLVEMANNKEKALCCGGVSLATMGKPGFDFRDRGLKQAQESGAKMMAVYCTGCQSVYAQLRPDLPIKIENIINLVGESLGIRHEDKLYRYFSYHDAQKVVSEAQEYIEASGLPPDKLRNFMLKYFR